MADSEFCSMYLSKLCPFKHQAPFCQKFLSFQQSDTLRQWSSTGFTIHHTNHILGTFVKFQVKFDFQANEITITVITHLELNSHPRSEDAD